MWIGGRKSHFLLVCWFDFCLDLISRDRNHVPPQFTSLIMRLSSELSVANVASLLLFPSSTDKMCQHQIYLRIGHNFHSSIYFSKFFCFAIWYLFSSFKLEYQEISHQDQPLYGMYLVLHLMCCPNIQKFDKIVSSIGTFHSSQSLYSDCLTIFVFISRQWWT